MRPETYAAWAASLGDRRAAARRLGCAVGTLRLRERGHDRVTEEAERRVREAVEGDAWAEDARRQATRERRRGRRLERQGMTAGEFRAALVALGWTREHAARALLGEGRHRVDAWARGERPVPWWLAGHLRLALGLEPGAPWPTGAHSHPARLPGAEAPPGGVGGERGKRGGGVSA